MFSASRAPGGIDGSNYSRKFGVGNMIHLPVGDGVIGSTTKIVGFPEVWEDMVWYDIIGLVQGEYVFYHGTSFRICFTSSCHHTSSAEFF